MMIKTLLATLMLAAAPAMACDSVHLHLVSYHSDRQAIPDVNEFNPGIECRVGHFAGGFYLNSYRSLSLYGTAMTHTEGFGAFIGVANGYDKELMASKGWLLTGGFHYMHPDWTVRLAPYYNDWTDKFEYVAALSVTVQ